MSAICRGCGSEVTEPGAEDDPNPPTPSHCRNCPATRCEDCGGWNVWATGDLCSCWVDVRNMPAADLKALFACDCDDHCDGEGLSVDVVRNEGEQA